MKKELYSIIILALVLISISQVAAVCTLSLDQATYSEGETAEVTAICDSHPVESFQTATFNWTNGSGFQLEIDITLSTPKADGTNNFFQTFIIPVGYVAVNGSVLNVNMTGTGLEGTNTATVQTAQPNDLIISDVVFSQSIYLEKVAGISFTVKDENEKLVSNAVCDGILEDGNGFPLSAGVEIAVRNGHGAFSRLIDHDTFREGRNYLAVIQCSCGSNETGTACFDEDGASVELSTGFISAPFSTLTWLNVNTVIGKINYEMKNEIYICANVTNIDYDARIPMEIFHQVRCSAGIQNDDDLDRILIVHDDGMPDKRGISVGITQMQCKEFTIPEEDLLQGRTNECYASTEVHALDIVGHILATYSTTTSIFNITSTELNLDADWQKIGTRKLNSIVNLSDFIDINGTGTGNIDIRLYGTFEQSTPNLGLDINHGLDIFKGFQIFNLIKTITIYNTTGILTEHIDWELEFLDDGNVEIELRNVPLTKTGTEWWNITLEFYGFDLRTTEALEGIENKTGTFHFDVDCPAQAPIGEEMDCAITAFIEETQLVQKEVDFTCYISTEIGRISELNFNQMITRTPQTFNRKFLITGDLAENNQHTLQCEAGYYNLGSRTDKFFDTFLVTEEKKGVGISLQKLDELDEKVVEKIKEFVDDVIPGELPLWVDFVIAGVISLIVIFVIILIVVTVKRKKKSDD